VPSPLQYNHYPLEFVAFSDMAGSQTGVGMKFSRALPFAFSNTVLSLTLMSLSSRVAENLTLRTVATSVEPVYSY
jgi:hypothetical protein